MKINEIIVESRSQLDEGMMDTIKSKLSGVYQKLRRQYPNFDEVFAVAKSHKSEINDIIEQLKAKKETGNLTKEDVVAAVMPLSKKIAGESPINEDINNTSMMGFSGGVMGVIPGIILSFIMGDGTLGSLGTGIFVSVALCATLGAMIGGAVDSAEPERRAAEEKEKQYYAHLATNGARTAQEKDDWERLWDKYGRKSQPHSYMSHVDIENYERRYYLDKIDRSRATTPQSSNTSINNTKSGKPASKGLSIGDIPSSYTPPSKNDITAKTGKVNGVNYNPEYKRRNR